MVVVIGAQAGHEGRAHVAEPRLELGLQPAAQDLLGGGRARREVRRPNPEPSTLATEREARGAEGTAPFERRLELADPKRVGVR